MFCFGLDSNIWVDVLYASVSDLSSICSVLRTQGGSSVASGGHADDKRLSEEVEAAVHHAVKVDVHHDVDQNDMPVPPDSVEFDKTTEI